MIKSAYLQVDLITYYSVLSPVSLTYRSHACDTPVKISCAEKEHLDHQSTLTSALEMMEISQWDI